MIILIQQWLIKEKLTPAHNVYVHMIKMLQHVLYANQIQIASLTILILITELEQNICKESHQYILASRPWSQQTHDVVSTSIRRRNNVVSTGVNPNSIEAVKTILEHVSTTSQLSENHDSPKWTLVISYAVPYVYASTIQDSVQCTVCD